MLCKVCIRVLHLGTDENPDPGTLNTGGVEHQIAHQPDLSSLLRSARSGCHICSCFLRENRFLSALEAGPFERTGRTFTSIVTRFLYNTWKITVGLQSRQGLDHYTDVDFEISPVQGNAPTYFTAATGRKVRLQLLYRKSVLPIATLDLASRWIKHCREKHATCGQNNSKVPRLPTRLLDVVCGKGKDGWRLCHTANLVESTEYLTLSHCWGQVHLLTLTSTNLKDFETGMSNDALPLKYKDAFHVVRQLGFRYIWVDSLCIIQDSEQDWYKESMMMDTVYQNSFCTIAAGAIPSSELLSGAFLKPSLPNLENIFSMRWNDKVFNPILGKKEPENHHYRESVILHCDYYGLSLATSPLATRSWCFQELALSPRILHFEAEQVFWECRGLKSCEAFPYVDNPSIMHSPSFVGRAAEDSSIYISDIIHADPSNSDSAADWQRILGVYTKGQLTMASDKLIAIAGVAKMFQRRRQGGDYVAGLWSQDLPRNLLWHVYRPKILMAQSLSFTPSSKEYRAPSWSWAAVDGVIDYEFIHPAALPFMKDLASVVDVQVTTKSDDSFGQVTSGHLEMCGVMFPSTDTTTLQRNMTRFTDRQASPIGYTCEVYLEGDSSIDLSLIRYLPILADGSSVQGLLLYPTNDTQRDGFVRVGKFGSDARMPSQQVIIQLPLGLTDWPPPGFEERTFRIY